MPVTLDGEAIDLGNTVFDLVHGQGKVVETYALSNQFRVEFGNSKMVVYDGLGMSRFFKTRTLFWHDPFIALPVKSDVGWLRIKNICAAVVREMRAGRDVL